MATNIGKDQPPAYTSYSYQASTSNDSAGPLTTPTLMPNHSTRASELSRAPSEAIYTTSQYLELTFSIMVRSRGSTCHPVVLAIDEDYETLRNDFFQMLVEPTSPFVPNPLVKKCMTQMEVVWGKAGAQDYWVEQHIWGFTLKSSNITAMLQLKKSRNGSDNIAVDW